jgi:hypothetical protein
LLKICQIRSSKVSYTYKLDERSQTQHLHRYPLILYGTKLVGTFPFRTPVEFVSGVEFKHNIDNTKNLKMYKPSFYKNSEEKKKAIVFWNTFTLSTNCPFNHEGWDPEHTTVYS